MPEGRPIVKDISAIVSRAQSDPGFRRQLEADPMGAAHGAGFRLTWQEIRQSLGLHDVPDEQLQEHIAAAVSGSCTTTIKW